MPNVFVTILQCAGSSAARRPRAARLRQARWAASLHKMRHCGREVGRRRMSELDLGCVWQGGQGMRIMTVAFALGTALVLCNLGTFSAAAHAREAKVVREPRVRLIVRVPVERPYWDSYIVPRYRYRPQDDRIDPCGPPVVPVVRYGPQEETVPLWLRDALGLGRVQGVSWPCAGS